MGVGGIAEAVAVRRARALRLFAQGLSQTEIARRLNCSDTVLRKDLEALEGQHGVRGREAFARLVAEWDDEQRANREASRAALKRLVRGGLRA